MINVFQQYKILLFQILFISFLTSKNIKCKICSDEINSEYSIDAWGNTFHSHHENEGLFCNSCSRIISAGVTNGGYIYPDGRRICSLCKASVIQTKLETDKALYNTSLYLSEIGIDILTNNVSISIVNLNDLNKLTGHISESKLKGFTETIKISDNNFKYNIFILNGLPKIEFEANLAHELLHVWLNQKGIILNNKNEEGFCNLGNYLIYSNSATKFANIHIESMEYNKDEIYGDGYRFMKNLLFKHGWNDLIKMLESL